MAGRNFMPGQRSKAPGASKYNPNSNLVKKAPPSFTFGVRHSPYVGFLIE
jgi:hypothetical protein